MMFPCRPIGAKITLSEICNHHCLFCYNPSPKPDFDSIRKADHSRLSPRAYAVKYSSLQDNLVCMLHILGQNEILYVKFTGGEPLVTPELLLSGLIICKQYKMRSILNTNLSIFDDKIADVLLEHGLAKLNVAFPTYRKESFSELTGSDSFDLVLGNLRKAVQRGFDVEAALPITKLNLMDIFLTIKFLREVAGVKKVSVLPVDPTVPAHYNLLPEREDLPLIFDQVLRANSEIDSRVGTVSSFPLCCVDDYDRYWNLLRNPCRMAVEETSLALNGDIKACTATNTVYGNLLRDGFERIVAVSQQFRKDRFRKHEIYPAQCQACACIEQCSLGCKSSNEGITGSIYGANRFMASRAMTRAPNQFSEALVPGKACIDLTDASVRMEPDRSSVILTDRGYAMLDSNEINLLTWLAADGIHMVQSCYEESFNSQKNLLSFFRKLISLGIVKVDRNGRG
jgi:AdoMet-dependent heme synthase